VSLWALALGTVIGATMSTVKSVVVSLMDWARRRDAKRVAEQRRIGTLVGESIVAEPLIRARTFTCQSCGQEQGFSQLERVNIYPCRRTAPEVECTSCRVQHEDGCGECMAAMTEIGRLPFEYLQKNAEGDYLSENGV